MYQTTQIVGDYINSNGRTFRAQLSFANGLTVSEQILSLTTNAKTPEDVVKPGAVISQSFTAEILGDLSQVMEGQTLTLSILPVSLFGTPLGKTHAEMSAYTHEQLSQMTHGELMTADAIPFGRYKVSSCTKKGEKWTLEAHDGLHGSDKAYSSGLRFPASIKDVEDEICNALAIGQPFYETHADVFDASGAPLYDASGLRLRARLAALPCLETAPEGMTMREVLGLCAALDEGACALLDREGNLIHRHYADVDYTVSAGRADEPEVSENDITIQAVRCMNGKEILFSYPETIPEGARVMTFDNPYMTQSIFDSIAERYVGFSYTPITVNHRMGDPRLEMLDIVSVECVDGVRRAPLMSLSYSFDGGLSSSIASLGKTDTKESVATNEGPITRQVKKTIKDAVYLSEKNMTEAFTEAINYINGGKGGYKVEMFNSDGQPTETYYTDNLDISKAKCILRINSNGIAGTSEGMNGSYNVAITNRGEINANQILTGILTAITIRSLNYSADDQIGSIIKLDDGTFSFAGGALTYDGKELKLKGSADITGGSLNIETSENSDSIIKLSCAEWSIELSPLQWVLTNSNDKTKLVAQAGALNCYDTSSGSDKLMFNLSTKTGTIITKGAVIASGDIRADNKLLAKDGTTDSYYDVAGALKALSSRISELEAEVF